MFFTITLLSLLIFRSKYDGDSHVVHFSTAQAYTKLCCAELCYAVLCCGILCCAVVYCAMLCCAVLCCAVICCDKRSGVDTLEGFNSLI